MALFFSGAVTRSCQRRGSGFPDRAEERSLVLWLINAKCDVTESCQSWLDQKVFGGVFRTGHNQNRDRDRGQDRDRDWTGTGRESPAPPDESSWLSSTELDDGRSFAYVAPPPTLLIQEEICSEICQSKERFTQSLGGLSEVPPPSPFYTNSCQTSPEPTGLTMKSLLLFIFAIFIFTALYS
ncbi:hypothetical protein FQN60_016515, partial [Etheostoma spectabile]